jgi:hypothetical protein
VVAGLRAVGVDRTDLRCGNEHSEARQRRVSKVAPRTLTILAAIRPGEEKPLRDVLRPIGDDIKDKRGKRLEPGAVRIEFRNSRSIHFARFAILDDPDRGPDRKRLLYSANYDGDLAGHLAELIAITSNLDAIWGHVEGYMGRESFAAFIHAHTQEPEAFYIAFRDDTVSRLQDAIAWRRRAQTLVDEASTSAQAPVDQTSTGSVDDLLPSLSSGAPAWAAGRVPPSSVAAIARLFRALPIVADLFRAVVRCGVGNVFRGTRRITASLDRYPLVRSLNRLTGNHMAPLRSTYSSVWLDGCTVPVPIVPGDEVPSGPAPQSPPAFREDVIAQNQLTLVTVVMPEQIDRVRAVMAAIDSYSRRLAPPGSLIGVSTIHFVKWLVIDNGHRLMMVSDYDGSWENYIDEFAEMILSGLDAIWETAYGYPPDGARDLPALKQFLRNHQVPSEVFFSAYPEETVLNVTNDRAFAHACAAAGDPLRRWLQRV